MPRIKPLNPAVATGDTAMLLADTRAAFGGTPNLFTTAAHSPSALGAMLALFTSLGRSSLGPKAGELVAMAVAQANGCSYCLSAHSVIGGMHGLDAAALTGARHGASPDEKTNAILKLALAIVDRRGKIDDATLATARAHGLGDAELVDVVAHVALNVFTNYLNNVAQTDVDFPVVPVKATA